MIKFKIGDRVRIKGSPTPEWMPKMPPLPDTIFKVEGTQNGKLILSMECSDKRFFVDAKHFELVEISEQPENMADGSYKPINEECFREMVMNALDVIDNLNKKWCQEELERIKSNTHSDDNFDCSNCPFSDCDPKTDFETIKAEKTSQ